MRNSVFVRHVLGPKIENNGEFEIKKTSDGAVLFSTSPTSTRMDEIPLYQNETLEEAYDRMLTGQMISDGYFLVSYESGFEIINYANGTNNTLYQNTCSCGSYEPKCKHLSFLAHTKKLKSLAALVKNV